MLLLLIAAGGFVGAVARWWLGGWVYARTGGSFPWGTLAVNVAGSFLLGLLIPALEHHPPAAGLQALAAVGAIGAFTTFSTFAYEAVSLIDAGKPGLAAVYAAASLGLGLIALAAGLLLARVAV